MSVGETRCVCVLPKLNCALAAVGGYESVVAGVSVLYVIKLFRSQ